MRIEVTRTCRYGHGELVKSPGAWTLQGQGEDPHPSWPGFLMRDLVTRVLIHECLVCGYTELVEPPVNDSK